jgi:hypothetical protein
MWQSLGQAYGAYPSTCPNDYFSNTVLISNIFAATKVIIFFGTMAKDTHNMHFGAFLTF